MKNVDDDDVLISEIYRLVGDTMYRHLCKLYVFHIWIQEIEENSLLQTYFFLLICRSEAQICELVQYKSITNNDDLQFEWQFHL